ncbi:MAG: hypothetical protein RR263_05845, partial [Oscillospiraceae bacterium]
VEINGVATTQAGIATQKATEAKDSETAANVSKTVTQQAMTDFLAMLGSDVTPLVGGKIPIGYIPATAINETFVVSSPAEMTALIA